jgi:Icc-related predicted phosphoesterase
MKLIFVSDTHNKLNQFAIPMGDILIHCGDWTGRGRDSEFNNFLKHLFKLPHKVKLIVAGNHDFCAESRALLVKEQIEAIPGCHYLDKSGIEIDGIKFWGSPDTPEFFAWAFNRTPEQLQAIWELIPTDTDVLITHGPPYGILDYVVNLWSPHGKHVGDPALLAKVMEIKPKIHAFGHIHCGYGQHVENGVKFLNCSNLGEDYKYANPPHEINYGDLIQPHV